MIFAVSGRANVIRNEWKDELYKYISGILRNKNQKLIAINGMTDHVHMLIGIKPDVSLSDIVRDIKANSSRFINEKRYGKGKFQWQEGFGAFSYSYSQIGVVERYIHKQEEHHKRKTFKEEYISYLKKYNVEYDERYIFRDPNE